MRLGMWGALAVASLAMLSADGVLAGQPAEAACPAEASADGPGPAVRIAYEAGRAGEALRLIDCEIAVLSRSHGVNSQAVAARRLQGAEIARWSGDFVEASARSRDAMQAMDLAGRLGQPAVTGHIELVAAVRFAVGADQDALNLLRAHAEALAEAGPDHHDRAVRVRADLAQLLRWSDPAGAAGIYREIADDVAAPPLERARARVSLAELAGDAAGSEAAAAAYVTALCNQPSGDRSRPAMPGLNDPEWALGALRRYEAQAADDGCGDRNLVMLIAEYAAGLGERSLAEGLRASVGSTETLGPISTSIDAVRGFQLEVAGPDTVIYSARRGQSDDPTAHQLAEARARERAILTGSVSPEDRLAAWRRLTEAALREQERLIYQVSGSDQPAPIAYWIGLGDRPLFEAYVAEAEGTSHEGAAFLALGANLAQTRDYARGTRMAEMAAARGGGEIKHPMAEAALGQANFYLWRLLRFEPSPALLGWARDHQVLDEALVLLATGRPGAGDVTPMRREAVAGVLRAARYDAYYEDLLRLDSIDDGTRRFHVFDPASSLAAFYTRRGRWAEAEPLLRWWVRDQPSEREIAALPEEERLDEAENRARALYNLAHNRTNQNDPDEARALLEEAGALLRRHRRLAVEDGEMDRDYAMLVADIHLDLGRLEETVGRPRAAAAAYDRAIDVLTPLVDATNGPVGPSMASDPDGMLLAVADAMVSAFELPAVRLWLEAQAGLASARYGERRPEAGRRGLEEAIVRARGYFQPQEQASLLATLADQRDPGFLADYGHDLAAEAVERADRGDTPAESDQIAARIALAHALEAGGETGAAEARLREAVALAEDGYFRPANMVTATEGLAHFLTRQTRVEEAAALIASARDRLRRHFGDTLEAQADLGKVEAELGSRDPARSAG